VRALEWAVGADINASQALCAGRYRQGRVFGRGHTGPISRDTSPENLPHPLIRNVVFNLAIPRNDAVLLVGLGVGLAHLPIEVLGIHYLSGAHGFPLGGRFEVDIYLIRLIPTRFTASASISV